MPWAAWAADTMWGTVGPALPLVGSGKTDVTLNAIGSWTINADESWFSDATARWWRTWASSILIAHTCDLLPTWQAVSFGPILAPPAPDDPVQPSSFELTGKDMRHMLTMRYATGPSDWNGSLGLADMENSTASFTCMSLGTIQEELVKLAVQRTGGQLPMVYNPAWRQTGLPQDDAHTRNYPGYNITNNGIDKLIGEITDTDGGPDFMLKPQLSAPADGPWTASLLCRHGMEGSPWLPQDRQLTWDVTVPDSVIQTWTVTSDASKRFNRAFAVGSGEGAGTLMRAYQDDQSLNADMPLLEAVTSHPSVTVLDTLMTHAKATVKAGAKNTLQVDATIKGDDPSAVIGTWSVGDRVRFVAPAGRRDIDAGMHLLTIISASYDLTSELVQVQLQEDHANGGTD